MVNATFEFFFILPYNKNMLAKTLYAALVSLYVYSKASEKGQLYYNFKQSFH